MSKSKSDLEHTSKDSLAKEFVKAGRKRVAGKLSRSDGPKVLIPTGKYVEPKGREGFKYLGFRKEENMKKHPAGPSPEMAKKFISKDDKKGKFAKALMKNKKK